MKIKLTPVEIINIFVFIMTSIPEVTFTILTSFNHKKNFVALHLSNNYKKESIKRDFISN